MRQVKARQFNHTIVMCGYRLLCPIPEIEY
uniref:Uncharacterized protein n=1 Tax=Anguilla anguilla TaxID=7936 RepID=A0A0E9TRW7_ANGAN